MIDIKSLYQNELEDIVTENGFPKFRAAQIYGWLNKNEKSSEKSD